VGDKNLVVDDSSCQACVLKKGSGML
jgi:hypothetical protein